MWLLETKFDIGKWKKCTNSLKVTLFECESTKYSMDIQKKLESINNPIILFKIGYESAISNNDANKVL